MSAPKHKNRITDPKQVLLSLHYRVGLGMLLTPKGPGAQIVYTLAPKYLFRHYFKAQSVC